MLDQTPPAPLRDGRRRSSSVSTISELSDECRHPEFPVLIVEDNQINQKATSTIIEKLGYPATIARNGQETVELCKKIDIELS